MCSHTEPSVGARLLAKKLVMADTTLFADIKEPKSEIEGGEEVKNLLMTL